MSLLHILIIDDDEEALDQVAQMLPDELEEAARTSDIEIEVVADKCSNFDEALKRMKLIRYDLVISDIYQGHDRRGGHQVDADARAKEVISAIKDSRFSPILLYTSSSRPDWVEDGPFLRYADKAAGDTAALVTEALRLVETGIPAAARAIHDAIDSKSATYIWGFFEKRYLELLDNGAISASDMERLLRRRIVIAMGRIDLGTGQEAATVAGHEYYIYPKIVEGEFRLGEVVKSGDDFRIILTPHCQLHIQQGSERPKADLILTARVFPANSVIAAQKSTVRKALRENLRKAVRADFGQPSGRYFFLPGLLEMPDGYCDFAQVESVAVDTLANEYQPHAVLDTPFAEALQAKFGAYYSSVGTPDLNPEEFREGLIPSEEE